MIKAFAEFIPEEPKGSKFSGIIWFTQIDPDEPVRIDIELYGPAKDGLHGLHVHEKSFTILKKCSNIKDCCTLLGGHFNPTPKWSKKVTGGTPHGLHVGDLDFNVFFKNNVSIKTYYDNFINLFPGHPCNIVGRSIVLHKGQDDKGVLSDNLELCDEQSFITGNAGDRIACANIEYFKY